MRSVVDGFQTSETLYYYDTGGRLRRAVYDSTDADARFFIWYDYDAAGRLHRIFSNTTTTKPQTADAVYTYNARGQVTEAILGDNVQTVDYAYNPRGFLTHINNPEQLGTDDRFAMQIGYDEKVSGGPSQNFTAQRNGNIAQIKWINRKFNDTPLYYTFGYDSRDQLVLADNSNNDFDAAYAYDANGNFTAFNEGTAWGNYHYETGSNRLDWIYGKNQSDNWGYDAAGRQTRDDDAGFSSASFHFPGAAFHDIVFASEDTLKMRYNGANRRLKKKATGENGLETDYIRDKDGRVLAVYEDGDLVERYVWGPLGLVKIVKGLNGSEAGYYVINDHLGYVRVVVDGSGDAVAGYDYFPYGKGMTGRFDDDSIYGSRFKFGGKEFDTDLGLELYYFEARFYNPEIGRFVSPDPLRVGWSHYAFANNNPLRFIDPTGLKPEEPPDNPILEEVEGEVKGRLSSYILGKIEGNSNLRGSIRKLARLASRSLSVVSLYDGGKVFYEAYKDLYGNMIRLSETVRRLEEEKGEEG